ncbi:ion transporter, partial [uncultured Neptuniibacter sp.]|uniref:ion transporter n=1 Tax=uncultured Neptuniibacter sp. TaxID=502143 RepID=UPI0032B23147
VFSFYGLIDLLAILPFYLAFAIDLRTLRLIRFLRLMRVLKLARYNKAMLRFNKALLLAKEELIIFTISSIVMLYLSAVGIYHFENEAQPEVFRSIFDSLWWAVATLTTVGYGDIYPITTGGRVFTFGILMVGLGLIAVPTGIIASALNSTRRQEETTKK